MMKNRCGQIDLLERKISKIAYNGVVHNIAFPNVVYFPNSFEWEPNRGLSIITGVNGIGKSLLLKFLYQELEKDHSSVDPISLHNRRINNVQSRDAPGEPQSFESPALNIQYIPHNFMPKGVFGPTKDIRFAFIEDLDGNNQGARRVLLNHLENKTKNTALATTNFITWENRQGKDFINSIAEKILKIPNYEDLTEQETIDKAKTYAMEEDVTIPLISTDFTLSFFISAFQAYEDLKKNVHKERDNHEALLNFYLKSNNLEDTDTLTISEIKKAFQDDNVQCYKRERLKALCGSYKTPLEEVNEQLAILCPSFKHKLIYQNDIYFAPKNKKISDLRQCYRFEQLSSGEQMILSVLSWQYCQSNFSFTQDTNRKNVFKSDIILLDEPDRHFDPKLSKIFYQVVRDVLVEKLGIQVIMTTHRIDTIALSKEGEVFTISKNKNNNVEISQSHKLLAMFRLTSNLREFTNHHHKVYTESRKDALFYEGVYKTLMQYSNNLRERREIDGWQSRDPILDNLLSRRFQLSFMSVSDNSDAGGNCGKVIDYIAKDITAYRNLEKCSSSVFYDRLELTAPYGIIDNDYNKKRDFSKIHNAEGRPHQPDDSIDGQYHTERVVTLKRHSLENYLCDPFILLSVFDDIKDELTEDIRNTLVALKDAIENNVLIDIQENAKGFFKLLLLKFTSSQNKILYEKNLSDKEREVHERIVDDINILKNFGLIDGVYDVTQQILIDKNIIEIYYPSVLLEVQGHTLAEALFGKDKKRTKNAIYTIASNVYEKGLKYIPLDLVKTIFTLNNNVRTHVRQVLKRGQQKLKWSKKLEYDRSVIISSELDGYSPVSNKRTREAQEELEMDLSNNYTNKTRKTEQEFENNSDEEFKEDSNGNRHYGNDFDSIIGSLSTDNNSNLKRYEQSLLSDLGVKYIKGLLDLSSFPDELRSYNFNDCIKDDEQIDANFIEENILGNITLIPEYHHALHKHNVSKIISMIDDNAIRQNSIVCLERKELGDNLGMKDVKLISNALSYPDINQYKMQNLPIYYDAILYNHSKAKGISVIGIEGKNLAYSKESSYYNQAREEYMAAQLSAIAKSGKNAIFLIGSAHINTLVKLLGGHDFYMSVNNKLSTETNLVTLDLQQPKLDHKLLNYNTLLNKQDKLFPLEYCVTHTFFSDIKPSALTKSIMATPEESIILDVESVKVPIEKNPQSWVEKYNNKEILRSNCIEL